MKYKIYSIWEDGYRYLYKETENRKEAAYIMTSFIYGTEDKHKYEIVIEK